MTDWNRISQNLSSRLGPETESEVRDETVGPSSEDVSSDVPAVSREAIASDLSPHSWKPKSVERRIGLTRDNSQINGSEVATNPPEVAEKIVKDPVSMPDVQPSEKAVTPGLKDLVQFDKDGQETGEKPSDAKPNEFDRQINSKNNIQPQSNPSVSPETSLKNNEEIAKRALNVGNTQDADQINHDNPLAQLEQTGDQSKIPDNANDGGGQKEFSDLSENTINDKKTEDDPAPVVTMDAEPNPAVIGRIGGNPDQMPEEVEDPALATLPPDDPYAVKIRRPAVSEDRGKAEAQDSTTYPPANENREPAVVDNNVDGPVSEIQRRIQKGNATFDHEVESVRAERAGSSIAPAPRSPGMQVKETEKPKVIIDGQPGILGRIEPEGAAQEAIPDQDYRASATKVTGNEQSGFFFRLSKRVKTTQADQEKLSKAA